MCIEHKISHSIAGKYCSAVEEYQDPVLDGRIYLDFVPGNASMYEISWNKISLDKTLVFISCLLKGNHPQLKQLFLTHCGVKYIHSAAQIGSIDRQENEMKQ